MEYSNYSDQMLTGSTTANDETCEMYILKSDLRMISSALKMITDMERIGDQASDISEITIRLAKEKYIKQLVHIPQMAEATTKMVKSSIDAYVTKDLDLIKEVIKKIEDIRFYILMHIAINYHLAV